MGYLRPDGGLSRWAAAEVDKQKHFAEEVYPLFDLKQLAWNLQTAREKAAISKDYSEVDRLKNALAAAGVEVRMSKTKVDLVPGRDFDPQRLGQLA